MFELLEAPQKSENDDKIYKVIKLKNGLVACLISDLDEDEQNESDYEFDSDSTSCSTSSSLSTAASAVSSGCQANERGSESDAETDNSAQFQRKEPKTEKMAAIAVTVRVGSFYDPAHIPGLAHFLEHMVFMGSEKYPNENDFSSFVHQCGGEDNATTDCETTTFYFDCFLDEFPLALDKFAQFFIKPLFLKDSIEREILAIDSEFQSAYATDHNRIEQLICSLTRKKSPTNKFFWGNKISLTEKVNYDQLHAELRRFHQLYYTADRFTVAVQAELPIHRLETLIINNFGQMQRYRRINNTPRELVPFSETVFHTEQFRRLYYVDPVGNINEIHICWPIFSVFQFFKSKPDQYLASLLNDETEGSIFMYLKRLNLITKIVAGCSESDGFENNSHYALFSLVITLTKSGCLRIVYILDVVFSYLNLLRAKGPQYYYFQDLMKMGNAEFKYTEEEQPSVTVENLSVTMHFIPSRYYLSHAECYFEFNPQAITDILNMLSPENMNVTILIHNRDLGEVQTEKWFGVKYASEEFAKDLIVKWMNIEPFADLKLPKPNMFLTNDFRLLPSLSLTRTKYPIRMLKNKLVELWYKADEEYELPTAIYRLHFFTNVASKSSKSAALLQLFTKILEYQLNDKIYTASIAGIECELTAMENGLLINIDGYNEKLELLFHFVMKQLKHYFAGLSKDIFRTNKEELCKYYYNKLLSPQHIAKQIRFALTIREFATTYERYEALKSITMKDLQEFYKDFKNNYNVRGLIQGNVHQTSGQRVFNLIRANFCDPSSLMKRNFNLNTFEIPVGENHFSTTSLNVLNPDSVIMNYYQVLNNSVLSSLMIDLFIYLIDEPIFDQLRTKEGLCYSVSPSPRCTYGVIGFSIVMTADANKLTTEFADSRIENFLQNFFCSIDDSYIERSIKSLIKIKKCPKLCLVDEVDDNWFEIFSSQYLFKRKSDEVGLLLKMKVSDVKNWIKNNILLTNPKGVRKVSIQVSGHKVQEPDDVDDDDVQVDVDRTKSMTPIFKTGTNKFVNYVLNLREFISKLNIRKI